MPLGKSTNIHLTSIFYISLHETDFNRDSVRFFLV